MFVFGAPKELEALVVLFEKLYVCTFDCADFYSKSSWYEKNMHPNFHSPPPLEDRHQITVLTYGRSESDLPNPNNNGLWLESTVQYVSLSIVWRTNTDAK